MAHRPHPHVSIPPGAAPPVNTSPRSSWSSYMFQSPAPQDPLNIWADQRSATIYTSPPASEAPNISLDLPSRPPSRATSVYHPDATTFTFPEPQLYRSASQRSTLRPNPSPTHRNTKSELDVSPGILRGESRPPSFVSTESSPDVLESEEGLRRFQAGELPENDEDWYRLVPAEAREVLDEKEVQRQSVLFEIIKSEKDYVHDLELIREVFVDPLVNTSPVPKQRLHAFISEVFFNLDQILAHHQRMLGALFERQRDQHPLIQSIADIILDTSFLFRTDYEEYIKHYPLAERCHRAELKRNTKYQYFIQQCSLDPRIRKRDLIHSCSDPSSAYHAALKKTESDHPDMETLPLTLGILSDFIKSTQPGIAAAESKSLVYQKGEIMDMDLYDESRTLVHSSPLARRYRAEMVLLLKPETHSGGIVKHSIVSRPIPLEYLRLATFSGPLENRKEKGEEGGIREMLRTRYRSMYPFTVYHASAKMTRRYTLYAAKEDERSKWHDVLVDALGVRTVRQETNMWFAPHVINEVFFKYPSIGSMPNAQFTGKITCAAPLSSGGKNYIAVGCPSGMYLLQRGEAEFYKVLGVANPTSIVALQEFNKLLILADVGLVSYSLDLIARFVQGQASAQHLEATLERIAGQDSTVLFFRAGRIGSRTMILYAAKSFMQVNLHALEVVQPVDKNAHLRRSSAGAPTGLSFRSFGEPLSLPKDTYDVAALHRMVAISTDKGLYMADPTNLAVSYANPTIIPKFTGAESNPPMHTLKTRCASTKPLGLVRCQGDEILVIYDELGCYIDKHGVPSRSSGYLRWESKASAYFIEVRTVHTGKLVQVLEGADVRLVYAGLLPMDKTTLVAMKGRDERGAVADQLMELVETAELATPLAASVPALWDEFDNIVS
ncbi:hypothetical protein B0H21DRAFT_725350 [Amylocystis lapponica]|nr:hypothetical protein B0H21DRAFT_725350 [Amylocystis lapponica]